MKDCPFCPVLLPDDPSKWNKVNPVYAHQVGDLLACTDCYKVISDEPEDEIARLIEEASSSAEVA